MKKTEKIVPGKEYNVQRELKKVEKLFTDLNKDKTLPTFTEHYMQCLILGVVEKVNLKKMYPEVYKTLNAFYMEHQKSVILSRK